ncbi:hypothetical protein H5P28_09180 [Ruficoccus amylovorans]|uniref:Uncharacterized protein n=1 Tax=Ruficoccus amylovorans TaxID=1804625 RepID=A0A842HEG0_9BACT|nr:hypothetical protein [Ruficoccus amylovorans]MBC2594428.1 hypothetical protein [Ruficoccus amylovorans]
MSGSPKMRAKKLSSQSKSEKVQYPFYYQIGNAFYSAPFPEYNPNSLCFGEFCSPPFKHEKIIELSQVNATSCESDSGRHRAAVIFRDFAENDFKEYTKGMWILLRQEDSVSVTESVESLAYTSLANLSIIAENAHTPPPDYYDDRERNVRNSILMLELVASSATTMLQQLCDKKENASIVRKIAKDKAKWPLMVGPRDKDANGVKEKLSEYGLALTRVEGKSAKSKSGKRKPATRGPDEDAMRTKPAIVLLDYCKYVRRSIPRLGITLKDVYPFPSELRQELIDCGEFGESNWEQWFEVGYKILLHFSKGSPYRWSEILERLGKSEVDSSINRKKDGRELTPDSEEKAYNRGIRRALRNSFKALAHEKSNE